MSTDLFAAVQLAPRDPILGLTEAFVADTRPFKVNLGVGVYQSEAGKIPLLNAVRASEKKLVDATMARGYLPIEGDCRLQPGSPDAAFWCRTRRFWRRADVATFEALGGTGGLKIGADFLRRISPAAEVWISDPSWENHRALFEGAGFKVNQYPYYNPGSHGIDADKMLDCLASDSARLDRGAAWLLPQPDRRRPGPAQWQKITRDGQVSRPDTLS